jgi:hypothetical protein
VMILLSRHQKLTKTVISSSTGCQMTTVESAMNVAQDSMHSAVDITAVSVARFSAVSVATKKCLARLWVSLVSYLQ